MPSSIIVGKYSETVLLSQCTMRFPVKFWIFEFCVMSQTGSSLGNSTIWKLEQNLIFLYCFHFFIYHIFLHYCWHIVHCACTLSKNKSQYKSTLRMPQDILLRHPQRVVRIVSLDSVFWIFWFVCSNKAKPNENHLRSKLVSTIYKDWVFRDRLSLFSVFLVFLLLLLRRAGLHKRNRLPPILFISLVT